MEQLEGHAALKLQDCNSFSAYCTRGIVLEATIEGERGHPRKGGELERGGSAAEPRQNLISRGAENSFSRSPV